MPRQLGLLALEVWDSSIAKVQLEITVAVALNQ